MEAEMIKDVLIIGAGRFGLYTAKKLHELGHDVMVVDQHEERINQILPYVSDARIGDSTDKGFLSTLGIPHYDLCIVAIGDDFLSSLQTTFTLDELGAKRIIARATSHRQEKFLLRNGASHVVFPERELGDWTAIRFSSDSISNYVDLSEGYGVFEIDVPVRWGGKRIDELDVRRKYHINILGVRDPVSHRILSSSDKNEAKAKLPEMNMDIRFDTVLHEGQTMLVLGKTEHIQKIL
jgi:trk system potassium uptake protein TrkA